MLVVGCGGRVDVTTFFIFSPLFLVLYDELLLIERGCLCRNGGCLNGVSRAEKGDLDDNRVWHFRQDEPQAAFLSPSAGTLDRRRVCSEETMVVLNGHVVRFPQLLGEG